MEAFTTPLCIYCFREVTEFRIKCAVCPDMVTLCLQCFSLGVKIGVHNKTHPFRVISQNKEKTLSPSEVSLFKSQKEWKVEDDFYLLAAVQKWSIGNWSEVASCVNEKSPAEAETHFFSFFVEGSIGQGTLPSQKQVGIPDCTEPLSVLEKSAVTHVDNVPEEIYKKVHYMPKKEFFSHQDHDGDVHSLIVDLTGDFKESDIFSAVELGCLDIYRHRATRRYKIEEMVHNYNLIQWYSDSLATKSVKTINTESALRKKMRIFNRLIPFEEHDALIKGVLEEDKLRLRVKELKEELVKKYSPSNGSKSNILIKAENSPSSRGKQSKSKDSKQKRGPNAASSNSSKKNQKGSGNSTAGVRGRKRPYPEEEEVVKEELPVANAYSLLSSAEKNLCDSLDLKPSSYMTLKIVLLRDFGILKNKVDTEKLSHISSHTMQTVVGFMSHNGWIKID